MYPDERKKNAVRFVQAATEYFASLGIPIMRVITDNGSAFRAYAFRGAFSCLGIRQKLTRAYSPQTNGKPAASSSPPCANGPTGTPTPTRTTPRSAAPLGSLLQLAPT